MRLPPTTVPTTIFIRPIIPIAPSVRLPLLALPPKKIIIARMPTMSLPSLTLPPTSMNISTIPTIPTVRLPPLTLPRVMLMNTTIPTAPEIHLSPLTLPPTSVISSKLPTTSAMHLPPPTLPPTSVINSKIPTTPAMRLPPLTLLQIVLINATITTAPVVWFPPLTLQPTNVSTSTGSVTTLLRIQPLTFPPSNSLLPTSTTISQIPAIIVLRFPPITLLSIGITNSIIPTPSFRLPPLAVPPVRTDIQLPTLLPSQSSYQPSTEDTTQNFLPTDVNQCLYSELHNCSEYARCINKDPGYSCSCINGFWDRLPSNPGTECDVQCRIDGKPYCENAGICTNGTGVNAPLCQCPTDITGTRCENVKVLIVSMTISFGENCDEMLIGDVESDYYKSYVKIYKSVVQALFSYIGIPGSNILDVTLTCGSVKASANTEIPASTTSSSSETTLKLIDAIDSGNVTEVVQNNVFNATVTDVNECVNTSNNNCHATALCSDTDPGYMCACREGYWDRDTANIGTNCELQCQFDGEPYCQNGGLCKNGTGNKEPTCNCALEFAGRRCEVEVDELSTTDGDTRPTTDAVTTAMETTESTRSTTVEVTTTVVPITTTFEPATTSVATTIIPTTTSIITTTTAESTTAAVETTTTAKSATTAVTTISTAESITTTAQTTTTAMTATSSEPTTVAAAIMTTVESTTAAFESTTTPKSATTAVTTTSTADSITSTAQTTTTAITATSSEPTTVAAAIMTTVESTTAAVESTTTPKSATTAVTTTSTADLITTTAQTTTTAITATSSEPTTVAVVTTATAEPTARTVATTVTAEATTTTTTEELTTLPVVTTSTTDTTTTIAVTAAAETKEAIELTTTVSTTAKTEPTNSTAMETIGNLTTTSNTTTAEASTPPTTALDTMSSLFEVESTVTVTQPASTNTISHPDTNVSTTAEGTVATTSTPLPSQSVPTSREREYNQTSSSAVTTTQPSETCGRTKSINEFTFPPTQPGLTSYSIEFCPDIDDVPRASIQCLTDDTYDLESFKIAVCESISISTIVDQPITNTTLQTLQFATANTSSLDEEEVSVVSAKLEEISDLTTQLSEEEVGDATEVISHLTEHYRETEVEADDFAEDRQELVQSLEKIARKIDSSNSSESFSRLTQDINIEVLDVTSFNEPYIFETKFYENESSEATFSPMSISLPVEALKEASSLTTSLRIVSVGFRSSALFPSEKKADWVISISLGNATDSLEEGFKLAEPIVIINTEIREEIGEKRIDDFKTILTIIECVFWDFQIEDWSEEGCVLITGSPATCECDHLTNFAIIVSRTEIPSDVVLSAVTYVGCGLSIAGLLLTFLVIFTSRVMRRKYQMKILGNICVCLAFALAFFVFGINSLVDDIGCSTLASIMQYFFLTTWFWMAIYSFTIYRDIVQVMSSYGRSFKFHIAAAVAYGVPLVIVLLHAGITLGHIDQDIKDDELKESSYRARNFCWLRHQSLYFGFLLPVGLLLLFNIVLYFKVIPKVTCEKNRIQSTKTERTLSQSALVSVSLATTMGLSWIFGYLMLVSDNATYLMAMSWLFTLVNSFQGVFIFYFTVIRSGELRRRCRPVRRRFSSVSVVSSGQSTFESKI